MDWLNEIVGNAGGRHQFERELKPILKLLSEVGAPPPGLDAYYEMCRDDHRQLRYLGFFAVLGSLGQARYFERDSLLDKRGQIEEPGKWRWTEKWYRLPTPVRSKVYYFLAKHYRKLSVINGAKRIAADKEARYVEAGVEPTLAHIKSWLEVRSVLAVWTGLLPNTDVTERGCPPPFPEVADWVLSLDMQFDRLVNRLRKGLLRDLLHGDVCDEWRAEVMALLQVDVDEGRWPTAQEDLDEVLGPWPGSVVPLFPSSAA